MRLTQKNGQLIWSYDPKVPGDWAAKGCCGVVNRGVAVWEGKVYLGSFDGRLIAMDAKSGAVIWETNTIDKQLPYTITGAPRIIDGKVLIGNGGAELGVRGYVSAYDSGNGNLLWRFYTVPGDPKVGFENETVARIATTWKGGEWWKYGGGGTVWDSMAYDPELNLLYIGVGNGSPWNQYIRSPGGGDNLFLSSIVAINPDDGSYVWHYQTTPGERWDYTATQHMILADLDIGGKTEKVLMQAPKNGFFYVLDRETGRLISAEPFVTVNWASHIDLESGRPIFDPNVSNYEHQGKLTYPAGYGGHNWHPMSYNPMTGLVYLPTQDIPMVYAQDPGFAERKMAIVAGVKLPEMTDDEAAGVSTLVKAELLAWNPVTQQKAWSVSRPAPWNGGVLSTAGNLVFQGTATGKFSAYSADKGEKLWEVDAGNGIVAPPITYSVDGEQFIAVMAGWGGAFALLGGPLAELSESKSQGRLLVFKLGGIEEFSVVQKQHNVVVAQPNNAQGDEIDRGKALYHDHCQFCHGNRVVGGGVVPDLRFMSEETQNRFTAIVLGGSLRARGMASFANKIDIAGAKAIHSYIAYRAGQKKFVVKLSEQSSLPEP